MAPTSPGTHVFDHALQTANIWLKELEKELHIENPSEAHQALRAVLHTLRDRLPATEAVQLGGQLPMLIAGMYYEGFKIREKPIKYDYPAFLAAIERQFAPGGTAPDPVHCLISVLRLLNHHVSPGELQDLRDTLPMDLKNAWARAEEETVEA